MTPDWNAPWVADVLGHLQKQGTISRRNAFALIEKHAAYVWRRQRAGAASWAVAEALLGLRRSVLRLAPRRRSTKVRA